MYLLAAHPCRTRKTQSGAASADHSCQPEDPGETEETERGMGRPSASASVWSEGQCRETTEGENLYLKFISEECSPVLWIRNDLFPIQL